MEDKKLLNNEELEKVTGGSGTSEKWYVVVPGDTLRLIANYHHTTPQAIFEANKAMLAERGIYTVQEFNAKLLEIKTIRIGY